MTEHGYTIAEIAAALGVSKQAIHKKRKSEPLSTSLRQLTTTVDGTVYISEDGFSLIKQAFSKKQRQPDRQPVDDNQPQVDGEVDGKVDGQKAAEIEFLREQIRAMNDQLKAKDLQLERLQKTIDDLNRALDQEQRLHLLTKNDPQKLEAPEAPEAPQEAPAEPAPPDWSDGRRYTARSFSAVRCRPPDGLRCHGSRRSRSSGYRSPGTPSPRPGSRHRSPHR